jgi:hypothetical protein
MGFFENPQVAMALSMAAAIVLPLLLGAAFLLGRHLRRRPTLREEMSPVSRQHIHLFQGGQLNESLVAAAKGRFRELLEQGDLATVEASLRPGTQYVLHVRALAELGTDDAGRILERQLQRRLTDDQLEQAWYWIDLANGLRTLNRSESLPHLLRCAETAGEIPLGHFFAAETVCFLGFAGYLQRSESPLGRAALRLLHRALEGLRFGVQPNIVAEARLGETIESLWDHQSSAVDPLMVRVAAETLRLIRRAPHVKVALGEDRSELEAFDWQMSRLTVLEPLLMDYLEQAPALLRNRLRFAHGQDLKETLLALLDLRAEAGADIVELLSRPGIIHSDLAVEALTWSRDPKIGPWLRDWTARRVPMTRRVQGRRRPLAARLPSLSPDVPYVAVLRALRGHPSAETEGFLLLAAQDGDSLHRAAALSSLGWWEPLRRADVLDGLNQGRKDPNADVRYAARAALARLGERQALEWFRQGLANEEPQQIHQTVQAVATEGLTLLWPDLDRLVDADNSDVAHHAREALERLCEDMEYARKQ